MTAPIPLVDLGRQHAGLRAEILGAMADVLDGGAFVLGKPVADFEAAFALWLGVPHAVGVSNGTAAIELVLEALGIGAGDEVLVPTLTFVATAEAVCAVGARPVFVDVEPTTYQLDPDAARAAVSDRTRAVIPVHLHGSPGRMDEILRLAADHDLVVVEDAAQAHGASYRGAAAGTLGDVGTFSFYPGKNLGALGDAGMVVTHRPEVAARVRSRRDHGRRSKHEHDSVGRNERLDALQAAVLAVKLPHVDVWNECRRQLTARYDEAFRPIGLRVATSPEGAVSAHHVYAIEVDNRDDVVASLTAHGIATGIHYPVPVHRQPAFRAMHGQAPLLVAEGLTSRLLSIPLSAELTDGELDRVVDAVLGVARPVG